MSKEQFQREVEDVFRAAAPRTVARRRAAAGQRHIISAATGGVAVHGNNNTVQIRSASTADALDQAVQRFRPCSRLFVRVYSLICSAWLATSLFDISKAAGNILNVGDWVRVHGMFFLVQATVGSALLTATILVPSWLLSRLFSNPVL
jgi:hypothetical protein